MHDQATALVADLESAGLTAGRDGFTMELPVSLGHVHYDRFAMEGEPTGEPLVDTFLDLTAEAGIIVDKVAIRGKTFWAVHESLSDNERWNWRTAYDIAMQAMEDEGLLLH